MVEADIKGFFDHMGQDWLLEMLSLRIDDRAFLSRIRKGLKAGILETDGKVIHPETGTPQGGVISPVLANVYLHYALDLWFEKVVKPHCSGEAMLGRYADDWVCAFRFRDEAERFYRVLPKRLQKFNLEVAPEKTRVLSFSRFQPSMQHRFSFLGFEIYWMPDRQGVCRVKRRTARRRLQGACRNARLKGHYHYYGVRGNFRSLYDFFKWARECVFKWLNRRSGRRSYTWEEFNRVLDHVGIARPRITEVKQRRVFA